MIKIVIEIFFSKLNIYFNQLIDLIFFRVRSFLIEGIECLERVVMTLSNCYNFYL